MTTTRTYQCNLCHNIMEKTEGHGIYFAGDVIQFKPVYDTVNHLCNRCMTQLAHLLKKPESLTDAEALRDACK